MHSVDIYSRPMASYPLPTLVHADRNLCYTKSRIIPGGDLMSWFIPRDVESDDMDYCVALYDAAINNPDDEEDISIIDLAKELGIELNGL